MSVDELLDFAIGWEQKAAEFYGRLAAKATSPAMRQVFTDFAAEERAHEAKLKGVKEGGQKLGPGSKIQDLKMSDYLVASPVSDDMDYQSALILAMKREKAAFKLYTDMAARATEPAVRDLLLGLAQEEAKHKLKFEVEYDDNVMTEN